MKPKSHLPHSLLLAAGSSLLAISSASAVDYYWDANGDTTTATGGAGIWNTSSSLWRNGSATGTLSVWPNTDPSNVDTARLAGTAGTLTLNSSSVNINVNKIIFGTTGYTIAGPVSGTAVLNLSGTTPTIDTGSVASTIITAKITGSAGLTRLSTGTLNLRGDNSGLSGTIDLQAGRLSAGGDGVAALGTEFGTGMIDVTSGAYIRFFNNSNTSVTAYTNNLTLRGIGNNNGAIQNDGGNIFWSGAITLGANAAIGTQNTSQTTFTGGINTAGNTVTFTAGGTNLSIDTVGISGAGSVIKNNGGTVTFNAANSHSVATTLNQGTLTVGATGTLSGSAATLAVNNTNMGAGTNVVLNLSTTANTTVGSLSGTIATPSGGTNTATINTQTGRTFTVNQTSNGTYAGVIAGGGGFTLGSSSTHSLTLSGNNTYNGATKVSGGTLVVNNTIANSATTVETTGVITGTGVLGSSLTAKSTGVVNAGTVGTINTTASVTGATTFESGSIFSWDLSADGATGDKLTTSSVSGSGAIFRILLADGTVNNAFFNTTQTNFFADTNIISSASDLTALFSSVQVYSGLTNAAVDISSRGSFALTSSGVSWTAVPEPTSALAGLLLGAGLLRRRRSGSSTQVPQMP